MRLSQTLRLVVLALNTKVFALPNILDPTDVQTRDDPKPLDQFCSVITKFRHDIAALYDMQDPVPALQGDYGIQLGEDHYTMHQTLNAANLPWLEKGELGKINFFLKTEMGSYSNLVYNTTDIAEVKPRVDEMTALINSIDLLTNKVAGRGEIFCEWCGNIVICN